MGTIHEFLQFPISVMYRKGIMNVYRIGMYTYTSVDHEQKQLFVRFVCLLLLCGDKY